MAENSQDSRPRNPADHLKEYRFVPGQSGNSGGRPKGLALLVRTGTKDGLELVEFWLDVMRANPDGPYAKAKLEVRLKASELLAERGFGKVEVTVDEEANAPRTVRVVAS